MLCRVRDVEQKGAEEICEGEGLMGRESGCQEHDVGAVEVLKVVFYAVFLEEVAVALGEGEDVGDYVFGQVRRCHFLPSSVLL